MIKGIEYIERLKEAYVKCGFEEKWKYLEDIYIGASGDGEYWHNLCIHKEQTLFI